MDKHNKTTFAAIIRGIRRHDAEMAESIAMQLASVRISPSDPEGREFTEQLNDLIEIAQGK